MNTSIYLWGCTCIPLKGGILHRYRLPLYSDTGWIQAGYRYRLEGIRSIKNTVQRVNQDVLGLDFMGLFRLFIQIQVALVFRYRLDTVSIHPGYRYR